MSEHRILDAIDNDDRQSVKKLLRNDRSLATVRVDKPKLYQTKIRHWIYVGDTPLHLAAAGYRVEIVQFLLDSGADPNSNANHRRSTPLHYAADSTGNGPQSSYERQVKTIQCLLRAGARINEQDKNGASPLHRAVRTRGAAAVKYLLTEGADPLLRNKPGSTAFHLAVQNTGRGGSGTDNAKAAQRQIIETFLSLGLSPRLKDAQGKSVFDWARSDWIRDLLS